MYVYESLSITAEHVRMFVEDARWYRGTVANYFRMCVTFHRNVLTILKYVKLLVETVRVYRSTCANYLCRCDIVR